MSTELPYARHVVSAVIVAHDGARWLPETIEALRQQTRPVQRVVAVDNGSRDRSAALLVDALGADRVLSLPRDTGYGAAVAEALAHPMASAQTGALDAMSVQTVEWVWLLHDDSAPAPEALEKLLAVADENRFAAVLGPKLRDWLDRRLLVEVGVTIDGAGRRETGLERREFDQGQHDGVHEVLAVSTAGMLVRRDVWDALGGLDPGMSLFRDDVDFCWRVNASGHRVLVVTDAVMYHAEASARRRRRIACASDHPRRIDRSNALFVLFTNLPVKVMLWTALRTLFGSLLRAVVFLLAKQPGNALDELVAYLSVIGGLRRLQRARRRRRREQRRTYYTLRKLMPPRWHGFRRLGDLLGGFLTGSGPVDSAGRHHAAVGGASEEEEDPLAAQGGFWQRALSEPAVLLFLALAVIALVAERGLLGGGRFGGGALVPVSGGAGDLWHAYLSGWHDVGLGNDVSAPPYVAVVALLSTVLLGKTWLAVDVILLGCVPFAGVTAYLAVRRVVPSVRVRVWAAASYALLPVATGAIAAGRLGTAAAFVLLPLIGLLAARMLRLPRGRALRAAWGVGLFTAVAAAFVPLVWPLEILLGIAAYAWRGRFRQHLRVCLAIALLVPPVLLLPWTFRLIRHPSLFLDTAGLPGPAGGGLDPVSVLFLQPGGPGMPPVWALAGLLVAGLAGLVVRREERTPLFIGWGIALLGMLIGALLSAVTVTPPAGGPAVHVWPGVAMALAGAGVILAVAAAAARLADGPRASGGRRWAIRGLAGLACSAPVLAAFAWVQTGVDGPLDRDNPDVLPAFVAAESHNTAHARTLVLRSQRSGGGGPPSGGSDEQGGGGPPSGGSEGSARVTYTVLRDRGPLLGEAETATPERSSARLDEVVAGLASGHGGGEAGELATYGIRYVLTPAPLDPGLVRVLDSVPGLARVSVTQGQALWRITASTARVRMTVTSDGGTKTEPLASGPINADITLPPGSGKRVVVLAESADSGWHATLDGRELPSRVVDGWAQGFDVPNSGGRLKIRYDATWRHFWVSAQAILAFVILVLALPGPRSEEQEEEQGIERPARRRGRAAPRRARGHRKRGSTQAQPAPATTVAQDALPISKTREHAR